MDRLHPARLDPREIEQRIIREFVAHGSRTQYSSPGPRFGAFGGGFNPSAKPDINLPTILNETVENDPKVTSALCATTPKPILTCG